MRQRATLWSLIAAAMLSLAAPVVVSQTGPRDELRQAIDFEQRLDETVPLDATFVDSTGQQVQLQKYFDKRPVVLALVYYECPMLCTEILNGLLQTAREMNFDVNKQYDVVAISIDPGETPALAAEKRDEYIRKYGREGTADGWHFLVGNEDEIKRVADSVGYKYVYDPETDEYAHASGIVVLTPKGKVSHYFYGVQYNSRDLRLGLVEASENKIGSAVDKILLYCFHYDPASGQYNVAVLNFVRVFGAMTVAVMVFGIAFLFWRERSDRSSSASTEAGVKG